jgi:hypothetical protein
LLENGRQRQLEHLDALFRQRLAFLIRGQAANAARRHFVVMDAARLLGEATADVLSAPDYVPRPAQQPLLVSALPLLLFGGAFAAKFKRGAEGIL